tara:strand:- start:796 stop:1641 length:846 start_codon:yes stop_codon:yes gene_type:complete
LENQRSITGEDIFNCLCQLGVVKGDTIFVHSQIFSLGEVKGGASSSTICNIIYSSFRKAVGLSGTIVVPTFTTNIARSGGVFDLDKSPSDTGIFTEYIRLLTGSYRSIHPINSVSANGPNAQTICENLSSTNYGAETAFDRMLSLDVKVINLGFSSRWSNSFHHHAETVLGLPYLYNKLLNITTKVNGIIYQSPMFASLRYLDFEVSNDLTAFDQHLVKNDLIKIERLGRSSVSLISGRLYYDEAIKKLKNDPWYFLAAPPRFRPGEIPYDGAPDLNFKTS